MSPDLPLQLVPHGPEVVDLHLDLGATICRALRKHLLLPVCRLAHERSLLCPQIITSCLVCCKLLLSACPGPFLRSRPHQTSRVHLRDIGWRVEATAVPGWLSRILSVASPVTRWLLWHRRTPFFAALWLTWVSSLW